MSAAGFAQLLEETLSVEYASGRVTPLDCPYTTECARCPTPWWRSRRAARCGMSGRERRPISMRRAGAVSCRPRTPGTA